MSDDARKLVQDAEGLFDRLPHITLEAEAKNWEEDLERWRSSVRTLASSPRMATAETPPPAATTCMGRDGGFVANGKGGIDFCPGCSRCGGDVASPPPGEAPADEHIDFTPEEQAAAGYSSLAKSGWTSCRKCGAVKPDGEWKTMCKGQTGIALRAAPPKGEAPRDPTAGLAPMGFAPMTREEVASRSVARRVAAQRGEPAPTFEQLVERVGPLPTTGLAGGEAPKVKPGSHLPDSVCHADRDGDCNWKKCPQKKKYQTSCPLWQTAEDE